jgi:peptidylprolyl isomerase
VKFVAHNRKAVEGKMALKYLGVILLVTLLGLSSVTGCAGKESSAVAKDGDTVKVHYTGTLEDGTIFDTSREREPLEFTLGGGKLIPGFEEAVRGMQIGQTKTVTIPPDEAYGSHRDELILVIQRDQLPDDLDPAVGQQLQMQGADGQTAVVVVTEVSEATITVDANHPLVGKDLTFEIELVEIN